jgi:hypothetical protein
VTGVQAPLWPARGIPDCDPPGDRLIHHIRLGTMGLSMGSLAAPTATCSAIARGGNRMLLSIPTAFWEDRHLKDDGRSGSARASGKARTLRTPASRRHRPLSAGSRTPRDLPGPSRAGDRGGPARFRRRGVRCLSRMRDPGRRLPTPALRRLRL